MALSCYKHASYIAEGKAVLVEGCGLSKDGNAVEYFRLHSLTKAAYHSVTMHSACAHSKTGKELNLTNPNRQASCLAAARRPFCS